MTTRLLPLVVLLLAACGGGGSDAQDPGPLFATTAPAGSLNNEGTQNGYRAFGSFAYTNTTGSALAVRITSAGQAAGSGSCDCYASLFYAVSGGVSDSTTEQISADMATVTKTVDLTVPAGATVSAETRIGYFNAVGAVTVSWSDFDISLTKR